MNTGASPLRSLPAVLILASTALLGGCGPAQEPVIDSEDPCPPVVRAAGSERPTPRPHLGLEKGRVPRPLARNAVTESWPGFLGPRGDGISRESPIERSFGEGGPRLVWSWTTGEGYASPSVLGDRLVFFHRIGDEEVVECLDAETGERFWRHGYATGYVDDFGYSNGPKCSPVLEGDLAWTYGVEGVLTAFHLPSGTVLWQRNLPREFGIPKGFFGVGTQPLLWGEELIINLGVPGGPCVAGFDKRTGRLRWGAGSSYLASYATPVRARIRGRDKIAVFAGGKVRPAKGGLVLIDRERHSVDLEFPWRGPSYHSVNASTPIVHGNSVFLSESYGKGAIRLDIDEAVTEATPAWRNRHFDLHWNTPLFIDGHLYGFAGKGQRPSRLVGVEWASGEVKWRHSLTWDQEIEDPAGTRRITRGVYRGSLLNVDGATLCLGEYGDLLWLKLTPRGVDILDRTELFDANQTWSLPVLSRGLLYICQNTPAKGSRWPARLYCYDLRAR